MIKACRDVEEGHIVQWLERGLFLLITKLTSEWENFQGSLINYSLVPISMAFDCNQLLEDGLDAWWRAEYG